MKQVDRARTAVEKAEQIEENVRTNRSGGNLAGAGYLKSCCEEKRHLEPVQLCEASRLRLTPQLFDLSNVVGTSDYGPARAGPYAERVVRPKPARQVAELSGCTLERQPPDEPRCDGIGLAAADTTGQESPRHRLQVVSIF